jgi:hypothetical protein
VLFIINYEYGYKYFNEGNGDNIIFVGTINSSSSPYFVLSAAVLFLPK